MRLNLYRSAVSSEEELQNNLFLSLGKNKKESKEAMLKTIRYISTQLHKEASVVNKEREYRIENIRVLKVLSEIKNWSFSLLPSLLNENKNWAWNTFLILFKKGMNLRLSLVKSENTKERYNLG